MSLQPDHQRAIEYLREEAGILEASPVVQEMIEREMNERFGRDWRTKVREWAADRAGVAA